MAVRLTLLDWYSILPEGMIKDAVRRAIQDSLYKAVQELQQRRVDDVELGPEDDS